MASGGVTGYQDLNGVLGINGESGNNPQGPFSGLSSFDIQGHINPGGVTSENTIWASDG
jgi:hypothetical protein